MKSRNKITVVTLALTILISTYVQAEESENSERFRIGTCDWSIKMPMSADSFRFAKRIGLRGIQYSFGFKGEGLDLLTRDKVRAIVKKAVGLFPIYPKDERLLLRIAIEPCDNAFDSLTLATNGDAAEEC